MIFGKSICQVILEDISFENFLVIYADENKKKKGNEKSKNSNFRIQH